MSLSDPDTSRLAALRTLPRTGTQRRAVLEVMAAAWPHGLTDPEITYAAGISPNSERPRRGELVDGGWVCDTGLRRATVRYGESIVWRLTHRAAVALLPPTAVRLGFEGGDEDDSGRLW